VAVNGFPHGEKDPGLIDSAPHILGIPIVFNLLALGIVALITIVLVWGIKESAEFNAVMVAIKILVLLFSYARFICDSNKSRRMNMQNENFDATITALNSADSLKPQTSTIVMSATIPTPAD